MSLSHVSDSLAERHAARFAARLAPAGPRLPAAYAATLQPFAIRLAESGETVGFEIRDERVAVLDDADEAKTRIELARADWEGFTQDFESAAGLIYGQRARTLAGDMMDFMQWEPALRFLHTGRPVYDPSAVDLRDRRGEPLDPCQSFRLDDDPEEMAHFLRTVGYLHVREVLSPEEVAALQAEAETLRAAAREGDQESWWGKRADGESVLCRVLRAGTRPGMRSLHGDPRIEKLAALCDVPMRLKMGPEDRDGVTVLWKQPGVEEGLSDLPWHRDCGLGGHASMCPTAVVSVFLGPNTPEAGELRFLPGSWQCSFPHQTPDSKLAPRGVAPAARPG